MFLTNERPNPYSELEEQSAEKKEELKEAIQVKKEEDKSPSLLKEKTMTYQGRFGFATEEGYADKGYGVIFSAVKPMPNLLKEYKKTFFQGDFLYTIRDLKATTGETKDYMALTGYLGYPYDFNEKTVISARMGGSFVTGSGKFEFSYAVAAKRTLEHKKFKLVAGWLVLGDLTVLSIGAEFNY